MRNLLFCLLVVGATAATPTAGLLVGNESPVVDAGLDQSVVLGSTVYLDAGGSYDPDGEIDTYEWRIESPNGSAVSPACPTCERTSFVPSQTGTYEVSVTATDGDGASETDTLYVTVANGSSPTVELSAPDETQLSSPLPTVVTVDAGAAPLDRIEWFVDGNRIAVDSIGGGGATLSREIGLDDVGTLDVRVVVVDQSNQRGVDRTSTSVLSAGDGGTAQPFRNRSVDPDPATSDGTARMVLEGPELLTGPKPLEGTYELAVEGSDTDIRAVAWRLDGRYVESGRTAAITFDPGEHDLVAKVITDYGVRRVGFPNDETTVRADPRPSATLTDLSVDGTNVSGTAVAADDYDNLRRATVTIDGETVAATSDLPGLDRNPAPVWNVSFRESLSPNTTYEITARVVDHRGQSDTVTRTVRTESMPEPVTVDPPEPEDPAAPDPTILSSEFVNGPVDSYDERIATDRYVAEHVTRIDLDGADPALVDLAVKVREDEIVEISEVTGTRYDSQKDILTVRSEVGATSPGKYSIEIVISNEETAVASVDSTFQVTKSPPQPILDVTRSGTEYPVGEYGMVVDATQSFDPDGSDLKYEWKGGATDLTGTGIGKLDSRKRASLLIFDMQEQQTTVTTGFLDYFNPGLSTVERASVDRISDEGMVYVRVSTPVYSFTKQTYDADLTVEVIGDGRVVEWENREGSIDSGGSEEASNLDGDREQYYTGLVAIERDELGDGPDVRIYNRAEREITAMTYEVPGSDGRVTETFSRRNITIESVSYEVNGNRTETVEVRSPEARADRTAQGYEVVDTFQEDVEYQLERRVRVTETSTERRTFESRAAMERFVDIASDGWDSAGTVTVTETKRVTETVWRDSLQGTGEFTGETRQVVPHDAETILEREFVEHTTDTVEVRERVTVRLPTGEVDELVVNRTETVERERAYWAQSPREPDHERTGATKEVPVDGAAETEYKFRVERNEDRRVTRYAAERTVSETIRRWQQAGTISAKDSNRQSILNRNDIRIADATQQTVWRLERESSGSRIQSDYEDPRAVNRTIVYVSGEILHRDIEADTTDVVEEFTERLTFEGALDEDEIRDRIAEREGEASCAENDPVMAECGGYKNED